MEDVKGHIIQRQAFQIQLEDQELTHEVQSKISILQDTRINGLLNQILDRFDDQEHLNRFESIELDLGTVSQSNYENEVVQRIEETLTDYLSRNLVAGGAIRNGEKIPFGRHKLTQFAYYLEHGVLSWEARRYHSPTNLFLELVAEDQQGLSTLLKAKGKKEKVRKRMILQFEEKELEQVVVVVAQKEGEAIIAYKRNMLEQQRQKPIVDTGFGAFRNALWEVILAYLFVESKSYYNKKHFLKYLIRKVAEKYNLAYFDLLSAVQAGIEKEHQLSHPVEFKNLIRELMGEENETHFATRKQEKRTQQKPTIDWVQLLQHYFETGMLSINDRDGFRLTRRTFNRFFEEELSRNRSFATVIDQWLCVPEKRIALFQLLEVSTQHKLLFSGYLPRLSARIHFLETIHTHSRRLPTSIRFYWQQLYKQRTTWLLATYEEATEHKQASAQAVLDWIAQELKWVPDVLFRVLEQIKEQAEEVIQELIIGYQTQESSPNWQAVLEKIKDYVTENKKEVPFDELVSYIYNWTLKNQKTIQQAMDMVKRQLTGFEYTPLFAELGQKLVELEQQSPMSVSGKKQDRRTRDTHTNTIQHELSTLILMEVYQQIVELPKQTQSVWFEQVLKLMTKVAVQYRINTETFIQEIIQFARAKEEGWDVELEALVQSNYYQHEQQKQYRKSDLRQKMNLVDYIFQKGTIPWWIKAYTVEQFNEDVQALLAETNYKKQLLSTWGQKTIHKRVFTLLEAHLSQRISLSLIAGSKAQQSRSIKEEQEFKQLIQEHFFNDLIKQLENYWVPLKQLSEKHLELLKSTLFQEALRLFRRSATQLDVEATEVQRTQLQLMRIQRFFNFLQRDNYPVLSTLFQPYQLVLDHIIVTSEGVSAKRMAYSRKQPIRFEHLAEYLANWFPGEAQQPTRVSSKGESHRSERSTKVVEQLKEIIQYHPVRYKQWLNESDFRERLIEGLKQEELESLITLQLDARQKEHFQQVLNMIGIRTQLRADELKTIKKHYFNLILIKQAMGNISSWNTEDWSQLLVSILKTRLGYNRMAYAVLNLNEFALNEKSTPNRLELKLAQQLKQAIDKMPTYQWKEHREKEEYDDVTSIQKKQEREDRPYKKLGEEEERILNDPIYITNAGLIILSPYLGMLFEKCELMQGGVFKSIEDQYKAVHLLEYAATAQTGQDEHELVINKILTGIPIVDPVERKITLSDQDKETVDSLLYAVTQQWRGLSGTSIDGLRTTFLQREAKLEDGEEQYFMRVEQKPFDMLLDQISWNISKIKLSWMNKLLEVEWR